MTSQPWKRKNRGERAFSWKKRPKDRKQSTNPIEDFVFFKDWDYAVADNLSKVWAYHLTKVDTYGAYDKHTKMRWLWKRGQWIKQGYCTLSSIPEQRVPKLTVLTQTGTQGPPV